MSIICKLLGHKPFVYSRRETSSHLYVHCISEEECENKEPVILIKSLCGRCWEEYVIGHVSTYSTNCLIEEYVKEKSPISLEELKRNKFPPILPELLGN